MRHSIPPFHDTVSLSLGNGDHCKGSKASSVSEENTDIDEIFIQHIFPEEDVLSHIESHACPCQPYAIVSLLEDCSETWIHNCVKEKLN